MPGEEKRGAPPPVGGGKLLNAPVRVHLGLFLTMAFWGSAYATSKMLTFDVPPDVGAVLRFGLGAIAMVAVLFRRAAQPVPPARDWKGIAVFGAVGVTAYNLAFFRGVAMAPASDAAMIVPTLSPLFTAAGGMLFFREPVRAHRVAGLLIATAGALVFFHGVAADAGSGTGRLQGDLYLAVAAACWSAASLLSRPLLVRVGSFPAAAWSMLAGSAGLLLFSLPEMATTSWSSLPPSFWWVLAYLVLFPTFVAYVCWLEGVRHLGPAQATSYMFLSPLFGILAATLFLGERITGMQAVGGAIMLLGVWRTNRSPGIT